MNTRPPLPAPRATPAKEPGSRPSAASLALQSRIRDLCVASEGRLSRSVCARCANRSPTMYCWRLEGGRLEFDGPQPQETRRDYDALKDAVCALLAGDSTAHDAPLVGRGDAALQPREGRD